MKCKKTKGVTTCVVPCKMKFADGSKNPDCKAGRRSFTLHPGKDNTRAKVARGKALHRKYKCDQNKRTGRFTSCHRRGK